MGYAHYKQGHVKLRFEGEVQGSESMRDPDLPENYLTKYRITISHHYHKLQRRMAFWLQNYIQKPSCLVPPPWKHDKIQRIRIVSQNGQMGVQAPNNRKSQSSCK